MHQTPSAGARLRHAATARCRSGVRPTAVLLLVLCACGDRGSAPPAETATLPAAIAPAPRGASPLAHVRRTASLPIVSPGDVVASRAYVGRQVRVTGRCLTPNGAHPFGPAIGAMNVWQLEWAGITVYVVGRAPSACTTPNASVDTVTITATVAEDTLPAIGDLPPAPRRYLVFAGDPPE